MYNAAQHLKDARKLIEKPENWTQGAAARAKDGGETYCEGVYAVCFCAVGAIRRSEPGGCWGLLRAADYLRDVCANIPEFNDNHTHAEVLAKFDEAIVLAEQK